MKVIRLREGKERSLLRQHPWVFAGSVAKGGGDPGETVRVESASGQFLAWAAFSPSSQIRVRAWSFDESERIDAGFFQRRVQAAVAMRARLGIQSNGVRLVHGEADGLPGLIVDRYADTLVAQFLAAGTEQWKGVIADALAPAQRAPDLPRALRVRSRRRSLPVEPGDPGLDRRAVPGRDHRAGGSADAGQPGPCGAR